MKESINLKILLPVREKHSLNIYHKCPYCGYDDWGSILNKEENRVCECDCGKNYLLTRKEPGGEYLMVKEKIIGVTLFIGVVICAVLFLICQAEAKDVYIESAPQPSAKASGYFIDLNGTVIDVPAYDLGDGTVKLWYKVTDLEDGDYVCNIITYNLWGEAPPVPFQFPKTQPESASDIKLIAQ
jgi:hypothetical protein